MGARPEERERFFDVIRNQWAQDMDVDDLARPRPAMRCSATA